MDNLSEKVAELARRRGFYSPTAEAYGGVAGFQTFGPEGAELKRNIENSWRQTFSRELGHREIEAPTVMPEAVFEASGHLDGFDDMIIECPECGKSSRADHIVEDNTEIEEAEAFSKEKIESLFKDHDLKCPSCGADLAGEKVNDFNLMFETNIGPGSSNAGYLRPETAQGIFTEFPRFKEYMRNQLPFGITQIGKAYRNEISPRQGLVRVREFTQAELEHFIDPEEDSPDIEKVKDIELKLYPVSEQQKEDGEYLYLTVEEAIDQDVIESEWIAYYLGYAKQWYESIGVDMDRFRFRQHLPDELAHYSTDCWDAESDIGDSDEEDWLEISGFSYRGCYDLTKHGKHSEEDFTIFKEYDEPEIVEEAKVDPDMGYLGPEFGNKAGKIVERLQNLAEEDPEVFGQDEVAVEVDGEEFSVPSDKCNFSVEEVKKSGEHITPHVAEPSFGVDRIVYTVLVHAYDEDKVEDEERTVLHMSDEVAPTEVAVFPLMDKEGLGEKASEVADMLRDKGFSVKYDDTGNIGRRYRRQDEVGTPVCITVDYETLEEEPETVTVRDRDSTEQERVEVSDLAEELS
ncbi:glycine--tRNA ligase [Candidatus Nanohalobium constans]|uniref:glycine--tRNA ligase n=1 Tax=Candidatus Nanohalobium constans TaxID=2565781 RepID=A0A5Q0UET2_9ARCH|nr:glycine--tRNA ligase [Candidatus Nanohalobium constans]QGA80092.1 glycyl-tRNA synthetase [Candidatus Nanohalobium constans]